MEGKMYVLLVAAMLATTLLHVSRADAAISQAEQHCREVKASACQVCSQENQSNCLARVVKHCDCFFNCQGPDCDCSDNTICAPLP